jgi:hypothetical protein
MHYSYDVFEPGQMLGSHREHLSQSAIDRWCALFPDDQAGTTMPAGMVAAIMMRAYSAILPDRTPGNVHASQRFSIHALPAAGTDLVTELRCQGKEIRKERRWVELATVTCDGRGQLLFSGIIRNIWAG